MPNPTIVLVRIDVREDFISMAYATDSNRQEPAGPIDTLRLTGFNEPADWRMVDRVVGPLTS